MAIANYISNANHLLPHGSTPGETKEPRGNGKLLVFLSSPPGGGKGSCSVLKMTSLDNEYPQDLV